jgi:SAM-dependent methyltransferase
MNENGDVNVHPFWPSAEIEEAITTDLKYYLQRMGQQNIDANVHSLMGIDDGFADRFNYLDKYVPDHSRSSILISGCAVGSEMILARRFGWRRVVGTEVNREYLSFAGKRLEKMDSAVIVHYDGDRLPFRDNAFSTIFSGHVIEHTHSPFKYFKEHLRVLQKGGYLFLEFPNRYNTVELHTNLPSVEYLPLWLRRVVLRYRSSKFSKYSELQRTHYKLILSDITPMSRWQIQLFTLVSSLTIKRAKVSNFQTPIKGYLRVLIQALT